MLVRPPWTEKLLETREAAQDFFSVGRAGLSAVDAWPPSGIFLNLTLYFHHIYYFQHLLKICNLMKFNPKEIKQKANQAIRNVLQRIPDLTDIRVQQELQSMGGIADLLVT